MVCCQVEEEGGGSRTTTTAATATATAAATTAATTATLLTSTKHSSHHVTYATEARNATYYSANCSADATYCATQTRNKTTKKRHSTVAGD